ncbi:CRP-like cAMP-binding protein [Streptomyces filamentosus]|uniref:cyclic nucleotide-binding domain-containing protein n=1 Tax=Streptomyces filamentosus TaxID=67294 RepID=UPI0036EF44DD
MTTTRTLLDKLPPAARARLLECSRPVRFAPGTRIFRQRRRADRFWIVEADRVELDVHVPGHRDAAVDTLTGGALLGCSWIVPPCLRHLGATDVRALEFDAPAVRELCADDPSVGETAFARVAATTARRLQTVRGRLLDGLALPHAPELLSHAR